MGNVRMTAKSVAEVADYFETLASDQEGCLRWQRTKRDQTECRTRADVWRDAAGILRAVEFDPTPDTIFAQRVALSARAVRLFGGTP